MRLWLGMLFLGCVAFVCPGQQFEITAIEKDGTIRWQALAEHAYTMQSRDGPAGSWEVVPPEDQWPIDMAQWLANDGAGWPAVGQRFYRVVAEPVSQPPAVVHIPGGTFTMGDSFGEGGYWELPLHEVTLSSFYMGETEVTKAQWDDVYAWATANRYEFDFSETGPPGGKAPDHPVQELDWYSTVKWCNARSEKEGLTPCYYTSDEKTTVYRSGQVDIDNAWVRWQANGYRLPTEAEWEYAARGGVPDRRFPWTDSDTVSHSRANYFSTTSYPYDVSPTRGYHPAYNVGGHPYTAPVGSFAPTGYGLYDMAGNVREWCWDWYAGYSSLPLTDPRGPASGQSRMVRGGGCVDYAVTCRVADRGSDLPDASHNDLGFRLVRSAQ